MEFNENGLTLSTLEENLNTTADTMKKILGNDYSIKAEGVMDNILVSLAKSNQELENQIADLIKQFDPKTADGKAQDALYERTGLYRLEAAPTKFKAQILGPPNETFTTESIIISDKNTKYRFTNEEGFSTDNVGYACVTFKSILKQDIPVYPSDEFEIIEPADRLQLIISPDTETISIGYPEESDTSFRKRFLDIKNITEKCTRNSVIKNLSKYTTYPEHLSVQDANSDNTIPAGNILITAKPSVDDNSFAKAIMENTVAGITYLGNTTVEVPLSNGDLWEVKFQKATDVLLSLKFVIKIKSGYYQNPVFKSVKDNIMEYLGTRIFKLGSEVYATEFIIPILQTDGVEAAISMQIKRHNEVNYSDYAELDFDELPLFSEDNIFLEIE